MVDYKNQLEALQAAINKSIGVISRLERKTAEEAYLALERDPKTTIVPSVVTNLKQVLDNLEQYRYVKEREESQIFTPRKALSEVIQVLEEIAFSQ